MVLRVVPSAAPEGSLEALQVAAARGDSGALHTLAMRLLPRVRNLVRYLVRWDAEVDDLAQDALVEIVRSLPRFRGEGSFEGWVHRITTRTVFAALSVRRHEPARPGRTDDEPELFALPAEGRTDDYMARRRMARALDRLPDEQRHALVLHHAVEMSVPEIAETLGAPMETIRSRLRLGRARLREVLEEMDR